jgi:phosphoribosylglycinamide formyltransferase-1
VTFRILVLISGSGTNLQALIDSLQARPDEGQIVAVISNRPEAKGLERARQAGIPTLALDNRDYLDREHYDQAVIEHIDQFKPDLVLLAGFMRILTPTFVEHYRGLLLNIHPSLLPKYTGLGTHQRAIDNEDSEHGTSVHFVTPELDGGPVVLQAKVPVFEDDTADDLALRVLVQEHKIYPLVVNWLCNERIALSNKKAFFDGQELPECGYASD